MAISVMPRIFLMACPSILFSMNMAIVEKIAKAAIIGSSLFQVTYLTYLIITTEAEVRDNKPDKVTASAYDGIRKGRAVIMNMPNPKPTVR